MRRRELLIGSAALLAAAPAGAGEARWSVAARFGRLDVALNGATLACDWLPPGATAAQPRAGPPLLLAGRQARPVSWTLAAADQPDPGSLRLQLQAQDLPLQAEITFTHDAPTGLILRQTVLRHDGAGEPVELRAALSFSFAAHESVAQLLTLHGVWAEETGIRRAAPDGNPVVLQSRAGKTGFEAQPYAALIADGAVTICQLCWSGNWRIDIRPETGGATVSGGLNRWRLHHHLLPGARLALPHAVFGRIEGGVNRATQALHDFRRARRPDPDRPIPVQFNSWYPYFGEPRAADLLALVPRARRLGCEVFVIDAGWYRPDEGDSEEDWEARLGDWRTSRERFPNGLREVSQACAVQGMRFGLWFEPEAIGRLSGLRASHPDWLHWIDGRPPENPSRAILNLGVPEARAHVLRRLSRIIEVVGVGWVKWDFNTDLGAGGWAPGLPPALTAQDPVVAHVEGLYELMDALRARFPDLVLEMCASGGSRMDCGLLSHAHVNWLSDQPSALRKLAIHFGSQIAHPALVCNDWLVEWPPGAIAGYDDDTPELAALGDLPFRLHVAMLGSFGISARVQRWSEADSAVVAAHVRLYRDRLRRIIHHGDQYLLTPRPPPSGAGDWAAIWYVSKDGREGALFAFRLAGAETSRRFRLPGLAAGPARAVASPDLPLEVAEGAVTVTRARRFRSALVLVEAEG